MYVAIGYGLANSIMLEGEEGVIIIDTLESCEVAQEVRAAFEKVRVTSLYQISIIMLFLSSKLLDNRLLMDLGAVGSHIFAAVKM